MNSTLETPAMDVHWPAKVFRTNFGRRWVDVQRQKQHDNTIEAALLGQHFIVRLKHCHVGWDKGDGVGGRS